jgi:hypothetical protein
MNDLLDKVAAWIGRLAGIAVNHYDRWNGRS